VQSVDRNRWTPGVNHEVVIAAPVLFATPETAMCGAAVLRSDRPPPQAAGPTEYRLGRPRLLRLRSFGGKESSKHLIRCGQAMKKG
jgi:hypothetical protein